MKYHIKNQHDAYLAKVSIVSRCWGDDTGVEALTQWGHVGQALDLGTSHNAHVLKGFLVNNKVHTPEAFKVVRRTA